MSSEEPDDFRSSGTGGVIVLALSYINVISAKRRRIALAIKQFAEDVL